MIHISQNIFETWKSNYELFSLVISWITWFLTVFFAAKSYFLEKKIWKMNIFHWKTYANRMSVFGTGEELFRIMFVNHSNVNGVLDQIYIEIVPRKFFHRILYAIQSCFSEEPEKNSSSLYWKVLYYIQNFIYKHLWDNYWINLLYDYILYDQPIPTEKKSPPFNVWPKEAMSIYFTYKTFIKDINTELGKNNAKIKEIWFITSEGLKISAKLYKKQLPWLNL